MYPRVKRVRRGDQVYEYVQLVEGRREGGKVRQRVVATLGRLDELKASGQLDRFAGAFARLDPPPVGTRRTVGPLLLVAHYLSRLGLVDMVDQAIPMRGRSLLTHGEVIAALVANRLCAPSPLYDVAGWASSAAVAELLQVPAGLLNDDRLGRALDAFAPIAEDVRGGLLLRTLERFEVDATRLHLDLTAVRFTGAHEGSALVKKGWAADRTIARQVKTLQASTRAGVALYFRPHQGSSSELPAFMAAIETLAETLPPGLVVVADSGLGYLENLCAADARHVGFVVPLRADTGWAKRFAADVPGGLHALEPLDYVSVREQRLDPARRTVWKGLVRPFPVTGEDGRRHDLRVAYIFSSEEATSVADARERALAKAEDALGRIRNGLGGRYYKTKKQVDARVAQILTGNVVGLITVTTATRAGKPVITWRRDENAIAVVSALDGLYALATNLPDPRGSQLSALEVLRIYKDQWIVEQRHRDLKQTLRVRPVFLHNDDRIEALIAVIGIALLIFGLIEAELRAALGDGVPLPGILPEGRAAKPTARAALAAFDGLSATYTASGLELDHLTQVQRIVLALLGIPLPWPESKGK
ncbi:MAG: IS1634 family transposase [Actinomycetota bacterium]|nr:IS1634 family transposase [Actinomycetota bacterium]